MCRKIGKTYLCAVMTRTVYFRHDFLLISHNYRSRLIESIIIFADIRVPTLFLEPIRIFNDFLRLFWDRVLRV